MASLTTRVMRRSKRLGTPIIGRRRWSLLNPTTLNVYRKRAFTHPHLLLPDKPSDTLVFHISVTRPDGSMESNMRTLHQIGMQRFGSGVSYNVAIRMKDGLVGLGQSLGTKGTHTVNWAKKPGYSFDQNAVAVAIVFVGMPGEILSNKAIQSAKNVIAAMILEHALTEHFDPQPHSFFVEGTKYAKDCPTDAVRDLIDDMVVGGQRLAFANQ